MRRVVGDEMIKAGLKCRDGGRITRLNLKDQRGNRAFVRCEDAWTTSVAMKVQRQHVRTQRQDNRTWKAHSCEAVAPEKMSCRERGVNR